MKRNMTQKIICMIIAVCFLFNIMTADYVLALDPGKISPGGLRPAEGAAEVRDTALSLSFLELTLKRVNREEIVSAINRHRPASFIGEIPVPDNVKFGPADYNNLPDNWVQNPEFYQATDFIEAFKAFIQTEQGSGYRNFAIYEKDYSAKDINTLSICLKDDDNSAISFHKNFLKKWNDMRKNDRWLTYEFPDGRKVSVSLSWYIFYRVALGNKPDVVNPDILGDAIWMQFLASDCTGGEVVYDNDAFKDQALFYLALYRGKDDVELNQWAVEHGLPDQFATRDNETARKEMIELALAINQECYAKGAPPQNLPSMGGGMSEKDLGNLAKTAPVKDASPVKSNVEIITAQINKLNAIYSDNAIRWSKKVPQLQENVEKAKASIDETQKVLLELLTLVDSNESLRVQKDKIIKAIELVFDEQGANLRADAKLYPIHPLQAAVNFIKNFGIVDPDFILSAILHDSIEDIPKYNAQPGLIAQMFGETVQRNVQSVTNKELSEKQKKSFKDHVIAKLKLDITVSKTAESLDAVMKVIEYQLGVIKEISDNTATLLLKSVDFSDNALTQKNLVSNPKLQSRLSSKYRDLLLFFAEEFESLAQKESNHNTALMAGLSDNAKRYRDAYQELMGYSRGWEAVDLHGKIIDVIKEDFGSLRELAEKIEIPRNVVEAKQNASPPNNDSQVASRTEPGKSPDDEQGSLIGGGAKAEDVRKLARTKSVKYLVENIVIKGGLYLQIELIRDELKNNPKKLAAFNKLLVENIDKYIFPLTNDLKKAIQNKVSETDRILAEIFVSIVSEELLLIDLFNEAVQNDAWNIVQVFAKKLISLEGKDAISTFAGGLKKSVQNKTQGTTKVLTNALVSVVGRGNMSLLIVFFKEAVQDKEQETAIILAEIFVSIVSEEDTPFLTDLLEYAAQNNAQETALIFAEKLILFAGKEANPILRNVIDKAVKKEAKETSRALTEKLKGLSDVSYQGTHPSIPGEKMSAEGLTASAKSETTTSNDLTDYILRTTDKEQVSPADKEIDMKNLDVADLTEAVVAAIKSDSSTKAREKEKAVKLWNNFINKCADGCTITTVNIADVEKTLIAKIKELYDSIIKYTVGAIIVYVVCAGVGILILTLSDSLYDLVITAFVMTMAVSIVALLRLCTQYITFETLPGYLKTAKEALENQSSDTIEKPQAPQNLPPMGGGMSVEQARKYARTASVEDIVDNIIVKGGLYSQIGSIREELKTDPTKLAKFEKLLTEKINAFKSSLTKAVTSAIKIDPCTKNSEKEEIIETWNNFFEKHSAKGIILNIVDVEKALAGEIKRKEDGRKPGAIIIRITVQVAPIALGLYLGANMSLLAATLASIIVCTLTELIFSATNVEMEKIFVTLAGYLKIAKEALERTAEKPQAPQNFPPAGGGMSAEDLTAFAQSEDNTPEILVKYIINTGLFAQVDIIRKALKENEEKLAAFEKLLAEKIVESVLAEELIKSAQYNAPNSTQFLAAKLIALAGKEAMPALTNAHAAATKNYARRTAQILAEKISELSDASYQGTCSLIPGEKMGAECLTTFAKSGVGTSDVLFNTDVPSFTNAPNIAASDKEQAPPADKKIDMKNLDATVLTEAVVAAIRSDSSIEARKKEKTIKLWNNFINKYAAEYTTVNTANIEKALAAKAKDNDNSSKKLMILGVISISVGAGIVVLASFLPISLWFSPGVAIMSFAAAGITSLIFANRYIETKESFAKMADYLKIAKEAMENQSLNTAEKAQTPPTEEISKQKMPESDVSLPDEQASKVAPTAQPVTEEHHPLITAIDRFEAPVAREKRPNVVKMAKGELENISKSVSLLHQDRIEIFVDKAIGISDTMKDAIKDVNLIHKKNDKSAKDIIIYHPPYEDEDHLARLLSIPAEPGVKRIVVMAKKLDNKEQLLAMTEKLLTMNFTDTRLLNVTLPDGYAEMKPGDKTFYQAEVYNAAILGRMVERDSGLALKAALASLLEGSIEGDVDTFIDNLAKPENEWASHAEKIGWFLGKMVRLSRKIGEEYELLKLRMKAFWTAA